MKQGFTDRIAEYFEHHRGRWIDGRELESVGGRYAWRSRVSDARRKRGLDIRNRQRRVTREDGTEFVISEYCLPQTDRLF